MNAELVGGKEFLERYFRDCDGANVELRVIHTKKNAPPKVVHQITAVPMFELAEPNNILES